MVELSKDSKDKIRSIYMNLKGSYNDEHRVSQLRNWKKKKNSGNLRTLQNNIKNDKFTGSLNNILEEPEEMTLDGKKTLSTNGNE